MKITLIVLAALLSACATHNTSMNTPDKQTKEQKDKKPGWWKRHIGTVQGGPGGVL